jgi:hypothetical protein
MERAGGICRAAEAGRDIEAPPPPNWAAVLAVPHGYRKDTPLTRLTALPGYPLPGQAWPHD